MNFVIILVISIAVLVITARVAHWLNKWNKYFTDNIDEI